MLQSLQSDIKDIIAFEKANNSTQTETVNGVGDGTAKKSSLRVVGRKSNRKQAGLPQQVTIKVDSDAVSCDSGDISPFETSPVRP